MKAKTIIAIALSAAALTASARSHDPYEYPRVLWDISSQQTLLPGGYPRLIPLNDGRLIAAAESDGIRVLYSSDNGDHWGSPELIAGNPSGVSNCVPDLIQLSDGTIIVGYNPRPHSPYSEERRFGIRCVRSTDNGKTWSEPIYIYDASHIYEDGCWEPSFLEMPDGELHCYFANEHPYTTSGEQEISMCRSFDKGLTWGAPERVTFRSGHRDGMPSAIITEAGEIVVIVEDNGHAGYSDFRATTMRCTLEENWHDCWVSGSSSRRHMIFAKDADKADLSAAPYLRRLRNGYTLASWQGHNPKTNQIDMYTAVGNKDALSFSQVCLPFYRTPSNGSSMWNSVNIGFEDRVFCLGSHGGDGPSGVQLLTGRVVEYVKADFGTPEINGSLSGEPWTYKRAEQLTFGQQTRTRSTHDFLYDNDNLYYFTYVADTEILTDRIDKDGVYLTLDMTNTSDTYPQEGMHRFFFNVDGSGSYQYGQSNRWISGDTIPAGVRSAVKKGRNYYMVEVAIPWSVLGWAGPEVEKTMRVNIEVNDIRTGELRQEMFPDALRNQSWTWPEFRLTPSPLVDIDVIPADSADNADAPVEYFNLQGQRVANPSGGIFIRRQGTEVTKEYIR